MIGTFVQKRMRSTTSDPSMSGRPRSTMTMSIGRKVAARIASAPLAASCTTKPLSSKPVRRKRRICTSSSTIRTMGEASFICVAFHLRDGSLRNREFDRQRGAETGPAADRAQFAAVRRDEGAGDPQAESGAADRREMAFAAHETVEDRGLFHVGEAGAFVAHGDQQALIMRARRDGAARSVLRILHRIVEDLH